MSTDSDCFLLVPSRDRASWAVTRLYDNACEPRLSTAELYDRLAGELRARP